MSLPPSQDDRTRELAANLARIESRIAAACAHAGRGRADVTLVVVTKTFPGSDIRRLASLGVRDGGENRVQEAHAKADAGAFEGLRVHLVGQLQTNKAAQAAALADVVHSLDRPRLVAALARGRRRSGAPAPLDVFIQVSLDGDPDRGGAPPHTVPDLVAAVAAEDALRLRGVMAVPPIGASPRAAFDQLRTVADHVRSQVPNAVSISAGMSADLEDAVAAGATHLRVGSAILGSRPSLR